MIKPIGDKILIKFTKQEKTEGGLILPERLSKVEEDVAEVLAVGTDSDIVVKPGDLVVFNPHAAMIITIDKQEYILLTQKGIICVTNFDREGR
jgi:chaperonin GroES